MYHLFYRSKLIRTQDMPFFTHQDLSDLPDKAMMYEIPTGNWYRLNKTAKITKWRTVSKHAISKKLQLQIIILT